MRNRDGSGLTQVPVASTPWAVEWAPDGTKLIVARSGNLFVMDPDGSDEVPLLTTPSGGSNPDWQPLPGAPYQGYPRPKGATPLRIPLVPAFQPCSAPDRTHGPPLAFGSCASPALVSSRLTVGTPDANGAPANSVGHIELTVAVGNPATLATEADISIRVSITDVRCAPAFVSSACAPANSQGGPDFSNAVLPGELMLRSTDRYNLPSHAGREPGTLVDSSVTFSPFCFATADTSRGAHCTLTTSANALRPGIVAEGRRANWEIGAVRIHDRAPAGDGTVFLTQGIFVP